MKKILLLVLVLSAVSCRNAEPVEPPADSLPKANTTVVYECNERLFARQNAFASILNTQPSNISVPAG